MIQAAKATAQLFVLAAVCLPVFANIPRSSLIAEKPHPGSINFALVSHRAESVANVLIAPGIAGCLYDSGTRPCCSSKERDAETGLDYFLARYYSGAQGRFTSSDEPFAGQSPNIPQSWNMYAYALNNPLMITDPTGRAPCANGINPLNGNICTEVVLNESSPETVRVKERAESGVGAAKEMYNMLFGLLNYTPAGLLYRDLAGKPGVESLNPQNTNEYKGMQDVRIASQFMVVGELSIPAEIQAAAQAIAHGHAFRKHGSQFTQLGVANEQQFQRLVRGVIENAKGANVRNLSGGRSAYWDDAKGIVVIHDPSTPDKGTAFIPNRGRAYFDGLR